MSEAEKQLREHQQQLDADGVMVGVSRQALVEFMAENKALREVYRCAKGLCSGEDWNGGTAALYYRKPLREAVKALQETPDVREA